MTDVIAAEWIKLRSVRSTYYLLGATVALVGFAALLAWYAAHLWDGLSPEQRTHFGLADLTEQVGWFSALCMAVLGTLAISSEYSTGTIRASLAAVPRRRVFLVAKVVPIAALALVAGQVACFATLFATRAIIDDRPFAAYPTPISGQLALASASGLVVMVFALTGLGLAAVLRSAVGAIATLAALWWVLPIVALNLQAPWADRVSSVMLTQLPSQLAGVEQTGQGPSGVLPPLGALAVMALYGVLPLGAAAWLIDRRDA